MLVSVRWAGYWEEVSESDSPSKQLSLIFMAPLAGLALSESSRARCLVIITLGISFEVGFSWKEIFIGSLF